MESEDDKKKLLGQFDDSADKSGDFHRLHPHAGKILEEIKIILQKSRTGDYLLKLSESYGLKFTVTPEPGKAGFLPEENMIMISAPPGQHEAMATQVLDLAAHLRDAEQEFMGYKTAREDLEPTELEDHNHAKNLDIIVNMCKISTELENEAPELKKELYDRGLKPIFRAFKNDAGRDELIQAYIEAIEEKNKK